MRILYVIHQFFPEYRTGTERVALNIARCMQNAGHYVHILSCSVQGDLPSTTPSNEIDDAYDYVWQGLPVTCVARARTSELADVGFWVRPRLVREIVDWIAIHRFDCAHVMHTMRMASALRAVQSANLPIIVTATDFFAGCYRINLMTKAGARCPGPDRGNRCSVDCADPRWSDVLLARRYEQARDWLASASERVAPSDYVADTLGSIFPGLPFRVIPHGVSMTGRLRIHAPENVSGGRPLRFGYVGAMIEHKGLIVLLEAFRQVPSRDISLVVFGGSFGDSHYARAVRDLSALDDRVEIRGELPHEALCNELLTLDVLCLPSQVPETFSMSFHEAKAAGVPALVSDLGAPAADVLHSGAGLAIRADDVAAWRDAIALVAENPNLPAKWSKSLDLPSRIEEEAFFYESLYRRYVGPADRQC